MFRIRILAELFLRTVLPRCWLVCGPYRPEMVGGQGFLGGFNRRPVSVANRPESEKGRKKALPMTGGSGDSWTRTNDPIDVNDVLSHHGRNYKPLSTGQQASGPLKSKDSAFRKPSGELLKTAVYPSVYPVHKCRTQPYTTSAVHKNGHQIFLVPLSFYRPNRS